MLTEFMLFAAVGTVATVAHFLTLFALVQFCQSPPVMASAAGFVIGALVSYRLNYTFTFKSCKPHGVAISKFFSVALAGLCINTLIMTIATQRIHYLLSQALATCIVLFWNYLCSRFWTFKESPRAKE